MLKPLSVESEGLFNVYEVNIAFPILLVNRKTDINIEKPILFFNSIFKHVLIDKRKPAEAGWVNGFSFKLTLYLQNICLPHEPI